MPPRIYLLATTPTDSVRLGFLPAAERLGLAVTLLTDQPAEHDYPDASVEVLGCNVRDFNAVVSRVSGHRPADAIFSNSDHLQTQTALAAAYFGLPGKAWQAALRTKDKGELRRHLARNGADRVWSAELSADQAPTALSQLDVPFPCVVKPRAGVASEEVFLAQGPDELMRHCAGIRARRPSTALVVEEYLPGDLHTLETLGDGRIRHVLGGFQTELSAPPHFVETRMRFTPEQPPAHVSQVMSQLDSLGVGFGACHTEYVVDEDGRARIIEVNYRAIGDHCDLLLADLLELPLFDLILRTHLGEQLPDVLSGRRNRCARVEYPCAGTAGTLTQAPPASNHTTNGVELSYRPLRLVGETRPLHRTNRDYLGVLTAIGSDQPTVDRTAAQFLAAQRWEITP